MPCLYEALHTKEICCISIMKAKSSKLIKCQVEYDRAILEINKRF